MAWRGGGGNEPTPRTACIPALSSMVLPDDFARETPCSSPRLSREKEMTTEPCIPSFLAAVGYCLWRSISVRTARLYSARAALLPCPSLLRGSLPSACRSVRSSFPAPESDPEAFSTVTGSFTAVGGKGAPACIRPAVISLSGLILLEGWSGFFPSACRMEGRLVCRIVPSEVMADLPAAARFSVGAGAGRVSVLPEVSVTLRSISITADFRCARSTFSFNKIRVENSAE